MSDMTHLCINCNAPTVKRTDDTFVCEKCGFEWDVAHEQTNAAYLRSQGREPAQPRGSEPSTADAPEADLMARLGIDLPSGSAAALNVDPGSEIPSGIEAIQPADEAEDFSGSLETFPVKTSDYSLNARFEGEPANQDLIIDTDTVLDWIEANQTVADLETLAEDHDVDLTGARRKADITERLLESGALTVVFNPDGTIQDVE